MQTAGLVAKKRPRGRYFRRREPKASFGEMLHIDGSHHAWLALNPQEKQSLIVVVDDATSRILYAQLWPEETTIAIMSALKSVVERHGVPMSLYSDRASWAFVTIKAGEKIDATRLTQVGRALKQLGVEHIPAYTPQARGRSERLNSTLQDRLVNELKAAGISTPEAANQYLNQEYLERHNRLFSRAARDPQSVFVTAANADLSAIFSIEQQRAVANDYTLTVNGQTFQLDKQQARLVRPKQVLTVRTHLDGTVSVLKANTCIQRFQARHQLPADDRKAA